MWHNTMDDCEIYLSAGLVAKHKTIQLKNEPEPFADLSHKPDQCVPSQGDNSV